MGGDQSRYNAARHDTEVVRGTGSQYPWFWRCSCGVTVGCFRTEALAKADADDHAAWQRRGVSDGYCYVRTVA